MPTVEPIDTVLRVAAGDPAEHSAVFRLWTEPSPGDLYIAVRSLTRVLKASIHASGVCRIAYTSEYWDRPESDWLTEGGLEDRLVHRFQPSEEPAPGLKLVFRIVIPWFSVSLGPLEQSVAENVLFVNRPARDEIAELTVFIADRGVGWERQYPGTTSMGTAGVARMDLDSDRLVLVTVHYSPLDIEAFRRLNDRFTRTIANESELPISSSDNLRAVLIGDQPDGSGAFYDWKVVKAG